MTHPYASGSEALPNNYRAVVLAAAARITQRLIKPGASAFAQRYGVTGGLPSADFVSGWISRQAGSRNLPAMRYAGTHHQFRAGSVRQGVAGGAGLVSAPPCDNAAGDRPGAKSIRRNVPTLPADKALTTDTTYSTPCRWVAQPLADARSYVVAGKAAD